MEEKEEKKEIVPAEETLKEPKSASLSEDATQDDEYKALQRYSEDIDVFTRGGYKKTKTYII